MNQTAQPRDAAAVVLRRKREICWARRSQKLSFLGGWHAFPGGKVEASDQKIPVKNCADAELAKLIAAAARECFEEIGVLLARGANKLTAPQLTSLHADLTAERLTFAEILEQQNLWLDAADFTFAGSWTTPAFSPVRFKTRFFVVECPAAQTPFAASGELENVEFILPETALNKWQNGEILCAPPILNTIRVFSDAAIKDDQAKIAKLLALAERDGDNPRVIEFNPYVTVFPLKTLTLPPATHTNCFIVGTDNFVVIDPASPFADEQNALAAHVDNLIESGKNCDCIFITHEHADHTGGITALQHHLRKKFDSQIPLVAHRSTAERLPLEIKVDEFVEDNKQLKFYSEDYGVTSWRALHTPGHARGHLAFYNENIGFLLSGDNVVSAGSVLIAQPDGNMRDYLYSLEQMRDLPNLRFLCGSHGAAVADARGQIEKFIEHRLTREKQILAAWNAGARTRRAIVQLVYADTKPELWSWAEKSVAAHLEKLQTDGLIEN